MTIALVPSEQQETTLGQILKKAQTIQGRQGKGKRCIGEILLISLENLIEFGDLVIIGLNGLMIIGNAQRIEHGGIAQIQLRFKGRKRDQALVELTVPQRKTILGQTIEEVVGQKDEWVL